MREVRRLVEIKRYQQSEYSYKTDVVIIETNYEVIINTQRLVGISATPSLIKELIVGYLFSEGLLANMKQLKSIEINSNEILVTADISAERISRFLNTGTKNSGCGSSLSSDFDLQRNGSYLEEINPEIFFRTMHGFHTKCALFKETGGVHSAALFTNNKLKYFASDIGRHNAVDKVAGMAIIENENPFNYNLISSGRISAEIIRKAIRLGIRTVISPSAPTSEAIRLGWEYNVRIVGFVRGNRLNLYTGFN